MWRMWGTGEVPDDFGGETRKNDHLEDLGIDGSYC